MPGAPEGPSGGGPSGGPSGTPDGPSGFGPWGGWCQVEIADLLTPSGIDLSPRDIELRALSADFVPTDFGLRGACPQHVTFPDGGGPVEGVLAIDRSYRYGDSFSLWLTQQPEPERTVDALYASGATFWSRGSMFTLWGWGLPIYSGVSGVEETATDVIERAIGELAPELALECFYRETSGEWSDLATLGIGDPRPVLSPGLEETWFYLYLFEEPPAACDALDVDMPVYFAANFSGDAEHVSVSAWPRWTYGLPGTGQIDDYSVWWSSDRHQLSAYRWNHSGIGDRELLVELAQAMDPSLDPRCLRRWRQLNSDELAALGLPRASAPQGWNLNNTYLQAAFPEDGCAIDPQRNTSFSLSWLFSDSGPDTAQRFISAAAYRDVSWLESYPLAPTIGDSWISWRDESGTSYSVYGYSLDGSDPPAFEQLAEVARSLDPDVELP